MPVDSRGPIVNAGMRVRVDENGVQTRGYAFPDRCQKPSPWRAKWIWLNAEIASAKEGAASLLVALFRKEIVLTEAPRQALLWMSADTSYRLYVNGRLAGRGPADIGADWPGMGAPSTGQWFYDHRDLTPYFHQGMNVVAIEVFTEPFVGSQLTRKQPGLLFEADLFLPDGSHVSLQSDATWRGVPGEMFAWTDEIPGRPGKQERHLRYDARREPTGWRQVGFDAASWPLCQEIRSLWEPLVASELPPLMEASYPPLHITQASPGVSIPTHPFRKGHSVVLTGNGSFRVVFDRVLSGFVGLKVKGGAGAALRIAPGEGEERHRVASCILGEGVQAFELPFLDSFSTITIEASNSTSPIEIMDVRATFASSPVAYKGSFMCSDPALNRIGAACRWAVQICMQTHHLDSPHHQEPLGDPGDYLIEAKANYYAFGERWLIRQDLRKFARILQTCHYHNFHSSYALLWLQTLLDYYDYTGDRTLIEELAPTAHGLLSVWATYRGNNGLISEAPNYMFMDWVSIAGFECHHPPAVIGQGYITAFYFRALHDAARIAEITGEKTQVEAYAQMRVEIAEAFNQELWNSEKGLYRDGKPFQTSVAAYQWLPADKEIETFSPHVNALAVLYDLAPSERQAAIMEQVITTQPLNCQPYFMHFVMDALAHAGLFDKHGTAQMRRWKIVEQTKTFREMWDRGDLSHGWVATPLIQMYARILGIAPLAPGFQKISIRPDLCDLEWADGAAPTPQGLVAVAWKRTEQDVHLTVTIPQGCEAEVALPTGGFANAQVTVNGKLLWNGSAPVKSSKLPFIMTAIENAFLVTVPAGRYRFIVCQAT